ESVRDEKVKVLKAIGALDPKDVVRGQFRGYRNEKGVAPHSRIETFAALRLEVNSWRWQGVPLHSSWEIHAGDLHGGRCPPAATTGRFYHLLFRAELLSLPYQP